MCLPNSPKANYKINTSKDGNEQTHTHTNKGKDKARQLGSNKNPISTMAPAICG
jgi:hypothetical protein